VGNFPVADGTKAPWLTSPTCARCHRSFLPVAWPSAPPAPFDPSRTTTPSPAPSSSTRGARQARPTAPQQVRGWRRGHEAASSI